MASSATNTPVADRKKKPKNGRARVGSPSDKAAPQPDSPVAKGSGRSAVGVVSDATATTVTVTTTDDGSSGSSPTSIMGGRSTPPPPTEGDLVRPTGLAESWLTRLAFKARNPRPPRSLRRGRIGGVAPFVAPKNRMGRWLRLRELGRRGYVPLSPGRAKIRHRILPRTVIGITTMLLMLGIGSAFSGAAFYAYYDNRLAENEQAVSRFVEGFDQQFTDATSAIDDLRVDTVSEIRDELKPLGDYVADADGVINLPTTAGPSVWLLETRDEDGEIMSGSAFAVVEHRDGTALVTSYALIVASITEPSPGIDLIKGNERIPAQLWAWDQERDVALLVVEEKVPTLEFAGDRSQLASVGARLFALSGVGGNGATASPGVLLDHSQIGLQHTAPVGTLFRGGPLLNGDGKVLGVASDHYRPFGIDPGDVRQAPDVRAICVLILECSEVREEITVEVAAEETDAPLTDAEPVRDTPTGEEIIPADDEETDQTRDGADDG